MRWISVSMVVLTACGSPIEQFCEAREACLAGDNVEAFEAVASTEWCVEHLSSSVPEDADPALAECAACVEDAECGEVEAQCSAACAALASVIERPGTASGVNGMCETTSTEVYATHQWPYAFDELAILVDCENPDLEPVVQRIAIVPGPESDLEVPCGHYAAFDDRGNTYNVCNDASGTLSIVTVDGRRSYAGTCTCNDETIRVDAPYRYFGWGL